MLQFLHYNLSRFMSSISSETTHAVPTPQVSSTPPVLLEGTLRTKDQEEDKIVLVTWEHEDILYLRKSNDGQNAKVFLVNSSVCTCGTFHPAEKFISQYNKLKVLLEHCKTGEIPFIALLNKLGFCEKEIENLIRKVKTIEYTFL